MTLRARSVAPLVLLAVTAALACRQAAPPSAAPLPEAALTACLRGVEEATGRSAADGFATVVQACRDLYRAPGCRDGMDAALALPAAERAGHVLAACAAAYCPILAEPRPEACTPAPGDDTASRRLALWGGLRRAILVHELGAARAADFEVASDEAVRRAAFVRAATSQAPSARPRSDTPAQPAALHLASSADGVVVTREDGPAATWTLPASPTAADFGPVVLALADHPGRPRVRLHATPDLPYATVVAAMDALAQAGFTDVSFATAPPAWTPAPHL